MIRGEFLADLVYEEWSSTHQVRVHSEVRDLLLPMATAAPGQFELDVSVQAASALLMLDPWDERAVVAMADAISAIRTESSSADVPDRVRHQVRARTR